MKTGLIFIPKTHPFFHGTFVGFSKLTRKPGGQGKVEQRHKLGLSKKSCGYFCFSPFFPSVKLQAAKYTETRIARNGKAPNKKGGC